MDEKEAVDLFAAYEKILLWHIASIDTVLRGHMKHVGDFIDYDLQHLSSTEKATVYGRQMQSFRD